MNTEVPFAVEMNPAYGTTAEWNNSAPEYAEVDYTLVQSKREPEEIKQVKCQSTHIKWILATVSIVAVAVAVAATAVCVVVILSSNMNSVSDVSVCLQQNDSILNPQQNDSILNAVKDSCAALPPSSPSGYYWVRASVDSAVRVYCDMTRICGGVTGGWMRVGYLDMTNSSQQCPSDLWERNDNVFNNLNLRTCGINSSMPHCSSVMLDTHTIPYSRVCGRILGYQFGGTDAFRARRHRLPTPLNIDSKYVDGISLTYGSPMRHHLWTFAAGLSENFSSPQQALFGCPCTGSGLAGTTPPPFVGNDYFCETGNKVGGSFSAYYTSDPLWDGAGCGTCCDFTSATPPWFYKQLPQPTTDSIEMRVCCDEDRDDEDIRIEMIEIFVQ